MADDKKKTSGGAHPYDYRAAGQPVAPPPKRRRRRLKKSVRRALVFVVAVVMLLSLAWVITAAIQRTGEDITLPSSAQVSRPTGPVASQQDDTGGEGGTGPVVPVTDVDAWNFVGPVPQQSETMELVTPDRRMIALPENGRIDMQYFNTAVFVGDSLTQGLQAWGGINNANFCAYKGVSPRGIYSGQALTRNDGVSEVPLDAMAGYQPDNVYVLLGANMVGSPNETLLAYYSEMLDAMRARLNPEVNIYVQSLTPVVQGVDRRFSAENIAYLNDQLAKMAWEKGMYFLDLHEVLAGDDGWMRPEFGAADGYHMQPAGYKLWVEYLVTHTAYDRRHAHLYLEDSAYEPPAE